MKKKKKKKIKNVKLLATFSLLLVLILTFLGLLIYNYVTPHYVLVDRTTDIKNAVKKDYQVMAWLKVQGTNIDYPVMQNQTINELDSFEGGYVWTNSYSEVLNSRVVVFGHNIRNVSSKPLINKKEFNDFENLPSFLNYDFVKKNKYVQYTINNHNYLYKIYAVYMDDGDNFKYDEYMNEDEREKYIEEAKNNSYFDFDIDVDGSDKIITLVTCTRFFGNTHTNMIVEARLVRDDERIKNYSVKEKDSYKEIKKTMEGDGENEKA